MSETTILEGEILPEYDAKEIERLLYEHEGSVRKVARALRTPSRELRTYIYKSAELCAVKEEIQALAVDESVETLYEGLRDRGSYMNRFYCSKEFIKSAEGRRRGFGVETSGQATLELKGEVGAKTLTIRWLEAPITTSSTDSLPDGSGS